MNVWTLVEISWKNIDGLSLIVNGEFIGRQPLPTTREVVVAQPEQINMFIGRSFEEIFDQKFGAFCVETVAVIQTSYETAVTGGLITPSMHTIYG